MTKAIGKVTNLYYVELIVMMIEDLGAESLYFDYGKNEISVYYG